MININDAKPGFHVFYQQPHMQSPEYGVITMVGKYVHVRFGFDKYTKACNAEDLYWPPNYCAVDNVNPNGQLFSVPETYYYDNTFKHNSMQFFCDADAYKWVIDLQKKEPVSEWILYKRDSKGKIVVVKRSENAN